MEEKENEKRCVFERIFSIMGSVCALSLSSNEMMERMLNNMRSVWPTLSINDYGSMTSLYNA